MAKQPCFECGSSDAVTVYPEGSAHCFSCKYTYRDYYGKAEGKVIPNKKFHDEHKEPTPTIEECLQLGSITGYPKRKISKKVDELYGVLTEMEPRTGVVKRRFYPTFVDGVPARIKIKDVQNKKFVCTGDTKLQRFFGQHLFNGGKMLVITEGEEDTLAIMEAFLSHKYLIKAVSVPNGTGDTKCYEQNLDWLEKFEKIILCYDKDTSGEEGVKKALAHLTPGKVYIARLPLKDASDMHRSGRTKELINRIYDAEQWMPGGIVNGSETWDAFMGAKYKESLPYFEGCDILNDMTKGIRLGEISLYTAGTGVGKTSFFKELEYHLIKNVKDNVGIIHLEEQLGDSVRDLMSIDLNKRIHLIDDQGGIPEEDLRACHQRLFSGGKVEFIDHFASLDADDLIAKIKALAVGKGCKYIFLDHISIAISEYAQSGKEREAIDALMTKLTRVVTSLGIWIGIISHLRKTSTQGESFELGAVPTLDDLRGSGGLKQMSWDVIALSRDQQAEDPIARNINHLHVLKCRWTGKTGPAGALYFDPKTGRMVPLSNIKGDF